MLSFKAEGGGGQSLRQFSDIGAWSEDTGDLSVELEQQGPVQAQTREPASQPASQGAIEISRCFVANEVGVEVQVLQFMRERERKLQ